MQREFSLPLYPCLLSRKVEAKLWGKSRETIPVLGPGPMLQLPLKSRQLCPVCCSHTEQSLDCTSSPSTGTLGQARTELRVSLQCSPSSPAKEQPVCISALLKDVDTSAGEGPTFCSVLRRQAAGSPHLPSGVSLSSVLCTSVTLLAL